MATPGPPYKELTPALRTALIKRTDLFLLNIITANASTQYASQAPSLARFRDAVSGTAVDANPLDAFRSHVPLSDYDAYKPWVARFHETPCRASRVDDLFAPGLPYYIAMSSSTSGKEPKLFPAYRHASFEYPPSRPIFDFGDARGLAPCIFYYGYREIKRVEGEPGQVVRQIPLCLATAGWNRMKYGWDVEADERRLSTIMPGQVAPFAANMIMHNRSFLVINGLFCLTSPDLDQIFVTFAILFYDLVRCVDTEWDVLVECIRDGRLPDLDGLGDLRPHLQVAFHANPARADALREIGPPSAGDGWAARVWPRLRRLACVCSGSFGTCLPQLRAILGPTIAIRNHGYGASEGHMSVYYDPLDVDTFVFETEEVIEFVSADACETVAVIEIVQGWDVQVGNRYQVVLTTRNGLWRYLIEDVIEILGFDPRTGSPVFKYLGRKTAFIRLPHVVITDAELVAAVRAVSSEEYVLVHDFTTMLDKRETPQTVGFFVELAGPPGPRARLTAARLFDILGAANDEYRCPLQSGETCVPTVRVVAPGTFMEFRRWKGERMRIGLGQIKVPVVLNKPEHEAWMMGRVVGEL